MFLFSDQDFRTVKCYTAVVTDNTSASVSIRQAGDDSGTACCKHFICISGEYAFVMRLSVFREDFFCHRVQFVAICFQTVFHHAGTTFRVNTAFQGGIGLQADNYFVFFVNITWSVSIYTLRIFCFSVVNTLLPFNLKHFGQFIPNFLRLV